MPGADFRPSEQSRIVVVGASLAGLRAVEALRRRGYAGRITWVGEEVHAPYDRPPLSKQLLLGTFDAEKLKFRRKQGFEELQLDMRLGVRAEALAPDCDRLHLSDGSSLDFDALIIATGARARTLPGKLPERGVHVLRTLDDGFALREALVAGPRRVAVVGGGFIGLEVASACRALDLPVTVVEQAGIPLARLLGDEMGRAVVGLHERHGVEIRSGVGVEAVLGTDQVHGVQLSGGERLEADLVVVGVGVVPNVEWLEGSGVDVGDGVLCDERCATSRGNVVACGDVARFPNGRFAVEQRIEHWTNAVEMSAAAVNRLLDGPDAEAFQPVPYVWSDQHDVKIQFAGHAASADSVAVLEGSAEDGKLVALYGRAGRLTGVVAWNSPARLIRFRRAIADGVTLDEAQRL